MLRDGHRHYLAPSDMAIIERVLAHPDLRQHPGSAPDCGAAKFLIGKFQEGMTEEDDLTVALDRYLRKLWAWQARPHGSASSPHAQDRTNGHSPEAARLEGRQQKRAESPALVISGLLGAANELGRLSERERARLLQRAAACIDDIHRQLGCLNARTIDPDGCDLGFDLAAMGSAIDLFTTADIGKAMHRAVATIGTLLERQDDMSRAQAEFAVVTRRRIERVWHTLRDWALRGERVVRQPTTAL